jgi:coproporphyrinogen III oxidase-like Fe-S oxidoreductase
VPADGFETVSIDLIYGLPGQTERAWRSELDRTLKLQVDHISCYQLTIHERTGLRTYSGVELREVRRRFGVDLHAPNRALIERLIETRLVTFEDERLVPTLDGLAVADGLAARFEIAVPATG